MYTLKKVYHFISYTITDIITIIFLETIILAFIIKKKNLYFGCTTLRAILFCHDYLVRRMLK